MTKKILGISSTQKEFEIIANPKIIPHSVTFTLRKDPKMHRNDPQK